MGETSGEVLRYSAFTEDGHGGNPAGIVLDASSLTAEDMLRMAAAVGFSETAFLLPQTRDRAGIRYFSPQAEVAFCGHATIATAVALAERQGPGVLHLDSRAGPVIVTTSPSSAGMSATLVSPPARSEPADPDTARRALAALRWEESDLDAAYPVHVASAGNDHLVVAARTADRLAAFDYDYDALAVLMAEQGWTTLHAFWAASSDVFHARNAFPPGGVVEDPATGAAAAAFGGYLRTVLGDRAPRRATILQGHHMGAPSRLLIDLEPEARPGAVAVTGTATRMDTDMSPVPHG
jgi:PhzF family phenazine biosynthesis protein